MSNDSKGLKENAEGLAESARDLAGDRKSVV